MVHGGMTFKSHKDYLKYLKTRKISIKQKEHWSNDFAEKLAGKYDIIRPRMPLQDNAKYEEWKIAFERYLPILRDNIILVGGSLGGIFLAKYLSEKRFPKKISAVYLIAPPFDDTHSNEDLVGGFKLKANISLIERNCKNITLLFSADDLCVPLYHAKKYQNKLKNAKIIIYKSKNGHFNISKFPELIKLIKGKTK